MSEAESVDGWLTRNPDLLRYAAPVAAFIGTGLLWRSGQSGSWNAMATEWLGFVAAGGIAAFPFGVYLIVDGCLALRRASAAVRWPRAKGKIESSEVCQSFGSRYYAPEVTYRYTVDDTDFIGETIQSTRVGFSETEAREIAGRYPVGAEVKVRYDPQRPWSCMLELSPGAGRGRIIVGAVCLAAPVVFATLAVWQNSYY
jgi:hypothetical protein